MNGFFAAVATPACGFETSSLLRPLNDYASHRKSAQEGCIARNHIKETHAISAL
jgi:hypothetical protein